MKTYSNKYFILSSEKIEKKSKRLLKDIILFFYDIYFSLLILFFGKKTQKKKYYLSICAIFKNEGKYLREWIEYNLMLGVEHFYLYNNFSSDDYLSVLDKYINLGIITLIDWPVEQGQSSAYKDCFMRYSKETSWLSCIDIDEFIVPKYETSLRDWLIPYEKYPSVAIYWKVFGTSGKLYDDNSSLVIENYTICWNKLDDVTKTIFNTSYDVFDYRQHHSFSGIFAGKRLPPINEFKMPLLFYNERWKRNRDNSIQINHYWSKAYSSFLSKQSKGDVFFSTSPYTNNYFWAHECKNISSDYSIYRFIVPLKHRLEVVN